MTHPCPQTAEAFSKLLDVLKKRKSILWRGRPR